MVMQEVLDEANNQSDIPVREIKNGMTLAEYIPEFRRVGMTNLKPSTRRSMESSIRAHLIPVLGTIPHKGGRFRGSYPGCEKRCKRQRN